MHVVFESYSFYLICLIVCGSVDKFHGKLVPPLAFSDVIVFARLRSS